MHIALEILNYFLAGFGVIFNLTLFPIIIYRSSAEIGTYKYLLALYTAIAGLFSIFNITMAPLFISSELAWIVVGTGLVGIPQEAGGVLLTIYCTCYAALLQTLVISYLYRYIYVCRPEMRDWFSVRWKVATLIIAYTIVVGHWGVVSFFSMRPNAEKNALYNKLLLKYVNSTGNETSYIGHTAYLNGKHETTMMVIIGERFIFIVLSNVIINKFAFSVVRQFKKDMSMISQKSTKMILLQKRLFTLLRLQTFCPIASNYLPALTSIVLTYLAVESEAFSTAAALMMSLGTTLDPILICIMVTDYRNFILSWLPCRKKETSTVEVSNISSRISH